MYQDYFNDVINYYRIGEKNADLPQRLMRPTPAGIKAECEFAFKSRFQKTDLRTLTAFFETENESDSLLRVIHRCERDRFKPLVNFLKGRTSSTDHLNIELLAWLIDFPNRPYKEDYSNITKESQNEVQNRSTEETNLERSIKGGYKFEEENTETEILFQKAPLEFLKSENMEQNPIGFWKIRQKTVLALAGVLLFSLFGFFYIITTHSKPQQCMIWVVDHYEPTSCEPKPGSVPVVALDTQKIKNFRMISQAEALKIAAIGKLWYIKRNGKIEYYTAGGSHPIESFRELRPITKYMIKTHLTSSVE